MGLDDMVSRTERVTVAISLLGRPAAWGRGDTGGGGGWRPRLLVLDIADRVGDGALGLAEAGCSELVERAGGSALWEMFFPPPVLRFDGGADEADL